ncbi:hypothetical protein [Candidatus Ichthyocystis hellenicum]|uniref:hypothetical protein n=1 Tax=Candidatus Ichthyocystis hellenicum TaxID=1561003 RepID=UPI000B81829E|nr:hypothetical protein [Candidatus Ichthyocystis hellenicum]
MENVSRSTLIEKLESEESVSSLSEPSCSGAASSVPRTVSFSSISNLMQIDCSFVDVDSDTVSNLIHSIRGRDIHQYRSAMHIFLEGCMSKSLQCLRLLKVEPAYFKISPSKDEYIVRDGGEYGRLQYMCDYFKYFMLGNEAEVTASVSEDEGIVDFCKESDCAERMKVVNRKLSMNQRLSFRDNGVLRVLQSYVTEIDTVSYGPTVDVTTVGTDSRILYTRRGYSYGLLLKELMGSETITNRELTDATLLSKIAGVELSEESADFYDSDFVESQLLLRDKFEQTASSKKLIRSDSAIRGMKLLSNANLETKDMYIRCFMKYYLSLRDKFEHIAKFRFKDKAALIAEEFELPLPELAQKEGSSDYECAVDDDMKIVKDRMRNYLKLCRGDMIFFRDRRDGGIIKFMDKEGEGSTSSVAQ